MDFHDSMNMGAAMAMAALDTILQNFRDLGVDETHYDKIITGDLGDVGQHILLDLLLKENIDIQSRHQDCGLLIFAGGAGYPCRGKRMWVFSGGALRVCFAEDQEWGVEKGAVSADGGSAFYGEL